MNSGISTDPGGPGAARTAMGHRRRRGAWGRPNRNGPPPPPPPRGPGEDINWDGDKSKSLTKIKHMQQSANYLVLYKAPTDKTQTQKTKQGLQIVNKSSNCY